MQPESGIGFRPPLLVAGATGRVGGRLRHALLECGVRPLTERLSVMVTPRCTRGRLIDTRVRAVPVAPAQAFAPVRRIGGSTGWYGDAFWRLRGFLDQVAGGVGLRRGRRDPETLTVGSALDSWRVEAYEPNLRAEMRTPGRAWLLFEVDGDEQCSRIRQTTIFDPLGLAGLLYWYALLPLHRLVFERILDGIAARASGRATAPHPQPLSEPQR